MSTFTNIRCSFFAVLIFNSFTFHLSAQNNADQIWMLGSYGGTLDWYRGLMYFDFSTNTPIAAEIESISLTLRWSRANFCDSTGKILFYTNGCQVQNKMHQLMENGDEINIGGWGYDDWCGTDAYLVPQSTLILPVPLQDGQFLFLHSFVDLLPMADLAILELRATMIDMFQNNGLGAVTTKNEILASKRFSFGKLTACRHANGLNWWIPLNEAGTDDIYFFLLDSSGVHLDHIQSNTGIVTDLVDNFGQAVFSPDGSFYARFDGNNELDVFKFDRCRGLFYAPVHINLNVPQEEYWGCGVAFSPNSRYLYASANIYLYQFDMQSPDMEGSKVLAGEYDGFIDFHGTNFYQQLLGPDGRIYMCSSSDSRFLHVINFPDQPGTSCGLNQHGVELPNLNSASFPNFPYLRLGAAPENYCDSIGLVSAVKAAAPSKGFAIAISPNPSNTSVNITFHTQTEGWLTVTNSLGRIVATRSLNVADQSSMFDVTSWPAGVYQLSVAGIDGQIGNTRFLVQH